MVDVNFFLHLEKHIRKNWKLPISCLGKMDNRVFDLPILMQYAIWNLKVLLFAEKILYYNIIYLSYY